MYRFIYEDHGYRTRADNWNAADVIEENGMIQRGTVVDIAPDGFVIDFGCAGQRRQLVTYGEAFSYWWDQHYLAQNLSSGDAVEVLLRDDATQPWIWRPATLVILRIPPKCGELALVDVQLRGDWRRQVVHYRQVRPPPSPDELQFRVLQLTDFLVTSIRPLPAEISGVLPVDSPRWKAFSHQLSLSDVSTTLVSSSEVLVLHRKRGDRLRDAAELTSDIRRAAESLDYAIQNARGVMGVEKGFQCRFTLSCGLAEVAQSREGRILQDVHHLVLGEMFTYLDTMDRVRQRRVCRVFDESISRTLSAAIRLTYRQCGLAQWTFCCCSNCSCVIRTYPLYAPLLNCITADTRLIILTNVGSSILSAVLRTLGVYRQLGQWVASRQVVVVAGQGGAGLQLGDFWWDADGLATSMAGGWCRKLLLNECLVGNLPGVRVSGALGGGALREGSLLADLCQLVESQLPTFDVQRTREWVARAVLDQLPEREQIITDLNVLTLPDPRTANAYAGYDWTEDNLDGLDVSKLSHLALYALSRRVPATIFLEPFAE